MFLSCFYCAKENTSDKNESCPYDPITILRPLISTTFGTSTTTAPSNTIQSQSTSNKEKSTITTAPKTTSFSNQLVTTAVTKSPFLVPSKSTPVASPTTPSNTRDSKKTTPKSSLVSPFRPPCPDFTTLCASLPTNTVSFANSWTCRSCFRIAAYYKRAAFNVPVWRPDFIHIHFGAKVDFLSWGHPVAGVNKLKRYEQILNSRVI